MALTRDKKKEILEKLNEISDKNSIVFVNFSGLSGNEEVAMRKKLRDEDVSYFVAKKSLVRKTFGESSIKGDFPELVGELAMAYSDDMTAPAREIYAFQKELDGGVSIMGGVFEKSYRDKAGMEEIALIPSLDVLRGMFVNVINSPIQGFVVALAAIAETKEA